MSPTASSVAKIQLGILFAILSFASANDYPSAPPPIHPAHPIKSNATCPTCPFLNSKNGPYPPPINAPSYSPIHRGLFFDVYGHWIENRYSEVFWTAQPAVPLPENIVSSFKGKSISFTGFEVDVVSGGDDATTPEWSVPEFQVYNHHYCATVTGADAKMVKVGMRGQDSLLRDEEGRDRRRGYEVHPPEWEPRDIGFGINVDADASTVPTAQNFWQGNGGEHRKSFKHLPKGTGQYIYSPEEFILQPMLINTNYQGDNSTADQNKTARELFYEAPLPLESLSPVGANYSGLMECPCTTRTKRIITGFQTQSKGVCAPHMSLPTAPECFDAVAALVSDVVLNVTDPSSGSGTGEKAPSGCYILAHARGNEAHFNTQDNSTAECGSTSGRPVRSMGSADSSSRDLTLELDLNGGTLNATITITGPSDVWFGVGFNASAMADQPYTITIEGSTITERKLANHMSGEPLASSIIVLSNTVAPGRRTLPSRMNRAGGTRLGLDLGAKNWVECRAACDAAAAAAAAAAPTTINSCGSWTYVPEHFTTPYNVKTGTCRLYTEDENDKDDGNNKEKSHYTSSGWIEGMLSGVQETVAQVRTVVLSRPLKGMTSDHFTFDPSQPALRFIEAVGTTPTFQYHGQSRGGGSLVLVEQGAPVCVCEGKEQSGSINGIPWSDNCHDWPDTTIKRDHNPSCSIETYGGGMICCHHGIYLLDKKQTIPPATFKYRMKYRFWYENPENITNTKTDDGSTASTISSQVWGPELPYQNAFFMFRETEVAHGEYDVPKCAVGTAPKDCVHVIMGNFQMKDTMNECKGRSDVWCSPVNLPNMTYPQSNHVALVHISPHCHGPGCISMEMIDVDRNVTICKTTPHYGTTDDAMNEAGYAAGIPPCVWGTKEEGLPFPPVLSLDTNITVIKRVNSTNGHRGVMAHWQMRGIWAKDPLLKLKEE